MNSTERASHPSRSQVEALVEFLEKYPNLAKGFPKVPSARDASRKAWEGLIIKLNNLKGCVKNLKQWMKYWADKKSAVKKKVSLRNKAKKKTGDGFESVVELSDVEERIFVLMRVESSSIENRNLENNPLPEPTSLSPPLLSHNYGIPSLSIEQQPESPTPSLIYVDVLTPTAEEIQSSQETPTPPRSRLSSPVSIGSITPSGLGKHSGRRQLNLSGVQAETTSLGSQRSRSQRRLPQSQQQSTLFYMTKQFVKLEQQRIELERCNSMRQTESNLATAKALIAIGEGLKLLAEALNKNT